MRRGDGGDAMGMLDGIALHRRRLDRMILVWPVLAVVVTAASIGLDRRDGLPFSWRSVVPGGFVLLWGGVIYLACRWSLHCSRRIAASIERP